MIWFNFKTAVRYLFRNKAYVLLNTIGLAIGIASSLLLYLWISGTMGMDGFHTNIDRLYAVYRFQDVANGDDIVSSTQSSMLVPAMLAEVPEIKRAVRIPWENRILFRQGNLKAFENGLYADSSFFEMFSFPLVKGDPKTVLNAPGSLAISEKLAKKYFGDEDPIGQSIILKSGEDELFQVTGVFGEVPENSSFRFDYIAPFSSYLKIRPWASGNWGNLMLRSFVELQPGASLEAVNKKIRDLYKINHPGYSKTVDVFLVPLKGSNVYPVTYKGASTGGVSKVLNALALVALFILIIACFNYINLATTLSLQRSKEVALKKINGCRRSLLVRQFFGESFLVSLVATLLAISIAEFVLPQFNRILPRPILIDYHNSSFWFGITGIFLFSALVSGLYPALFLSSYKPLVTLSRQALPRSRGYIFRKSLVIFQFVVSVFLIFIMLVIQTQISYIRNKDIGMDRENVIGFSCYTNISKHRDAFRQEIQAVPGVHSVTYSSGSPLQVNSSTTDPHWEGKEEGDNRWFFTISTDYDFIETFGIKLVAGRDFSREFPSDTVNFILNQKAVAAMGMKDPVGQKMDMWGRSGQIIGVVKDFNFAHMSTQVSQMVIQLYPENTYEAFIKIEAGRADVAIPGIRKVFEKYEPDFPFEFKFQNDQFNEMYKSDMFLIGAVSKAATLLAIIISCLGLFGLSSLAARQRSKEIGIRKVNGASSMQISRMLIMEFFRIVGLAYVVGAGAGWITAHLVLQNFANRVSIGLPLFLVSGGFIFIIALVTLVGQSWKASVSNPVDVLRTE